MAGYGNSGNSNARTQGGYGRGNQRTGGAPAPATSSRPAGNGEQQREEPVFTKLVTIRQTKAGNMTFSTGKDGMQIPANTKVVVTPLSEKRLTALQAAAKEKGYESKVTHEIVGFRIDLDAVRGGKK